MAGNQFKLFMRADGPRTTDDLLRNHPSDEVVVKFVVRVLLATASSGTGKVWAVGRIEMMAKFSYDYG